MSSKKLWIFPKWNTIIVRQRSEVSCVSVRERKFSQNNRRLGDKSPRGKIYFGWSLGPSSIFKSAWEMIQSSLDERGIITDQLLGIRFHLSWNPFLKCEVEWSTSWVSSLVAKSQRSEAQGKWLHPEDSKPHAACFSAEVTVAKTHATMSDYALIRCPINWSVSDQFSDIWSVSDQCLIRIWSDSNQAE